VSSVGTAERPDREPTALPRWLAAILIGVIALASLVALVWPSLPFARTPAPTAEVGVVRSQIEGEGVGGRISANAPNFEWTGPGGQLVRLSDYRGKTVVINFWATWCQPCRQEMPTLQRVATTEPDVVFLQVDLQESGEKVMSFLEQLGLDRLQPVLDINGETTRRFGVLSLPSTFFVDPKGVIRHLELGGPLSEAQVRTGIAKAR
jgi:thiol-disulfide isomerase/thioredoxin